MHGGRVSGDPLCSLCLSSTMATLLASRRFVLSSSKLVSSSLPLNSSSARTATLVARNMSTQQFTQVRPVAATAALNAGHTHSSHTSCSLFLRSPTSMCTRLHDVYRSQMY